MAAPIRLRRHARARLPGFALTLGMTIAWLGIMVVLPLTAMLGRSMTLGLSHFVDAAFAPRALAAYRLSFGAAALAGAIDLVAGVLVAWVLVRYDFPGKRLASAIVDIPFALPTAVAGIALTAMYAPNGAVGSLFARIGVDVAYRPQGVVVALVFIGLPFVVRTVEPVLADLGRDIEEAAATLGAGRGATFFRVLLPEIAPAAMTGFALTFARGLGEYGSVIFIAGNMPFKSEIAPLLIVTELEQFDYAGATAIATVLLAVSFVILTAINRTQARERFRLGQT